MDRKDKFSIDINNGYVCSGDSIILGSAILDGQPVAGAQVKVIPVLFIRIQIKKAHHDFPWVCQALDIPVNLRDHRFKQGSIG